MVLRRNYRTIMARHQVKGVSRDQLRFMDHQNSPDTMALSKFTHHLLPSYHHLHRTLSDHPESPSLIMDPRNHRSALRHRILDPNLVTVHRNCISAHHQPRSDPRDYNLVDLHQSFLVHRIINTDLLDSEATNPADMLLPSLLL